MQDKQKRVEAVNQLIKVIGDNGRNFFKSGDRYASVEIDVRGRVWWIDDYTQERIYTHYQYRWRGFSHGGTLRSLAEGFRDYITRGAPVNGVRFGPWPEWMCSGDPWGYGEDMEAVRAAAKDLGII